MRGPRVPFLERLGPGAGGVRAALPSRFAAAPAAWVDAPLPAADAETVNVNVNANVNAHAHVHEDEISVPRDAAPMPLRDARGLPRAAQAPSGPAATISHVEAAVVVTESGGLSLSHFIPQAAVTAAASVTAARDLHSAPAPEPPPVSSSAHVAVVAAPSSPAAITPALPLRESSLPVRPEPAAEAPLVVHVSIDRIEVRAAPATKPRSEPAPAKRGPATQPLAEYLRQRAGRKESV